MADKKEEKKSILEEALLEADQITKTATNNAKEILASQMKPEIEKIVKEAIEEDEKSHEQQNNDDVVEEKNEDDELESELEKDNIEVEEPSDDIEPEGDIDQVDLTGSDDSEVIKVFKKINDGDQIEITKEGDSVNLKDGDSEYHIELKESENKKDKLNENGICEECPDNNSTDMENEVIYEIELDEDKDLDENKEVQKENDIKEDKVEENEELEETFNVTHTEGKNVTSKPKNFNVRHRVGDDRYGSLYQEQVKRNKQLVEKFNSLKTKAVKILSENKELKDKEGKYKSALIDLKNRFNKMGVFNSNLAHVAKILSEQSTTKQEKTDILKRFDKVETINESKSLYKTIVDELKKEPIKESVEKKIIKTSESGTSKQITESVKSVDPQIERMMKLINYSSKGK